MVRIEGIAHGQMEMKHRALVTNVGNIGAAANTGFYERNLHLPENLTDHFRCRFIPNEVVVFIPHLFYFIRRFRRQGGAGKAVHNAFYDLVEVGPRRVADAAFEFGKVRDDVRRRAAVDDIRADTRIGQDVLAQHIDGME